MSEKTLAKSLNALPLSRCCVLDHAHCARQGVPGGGAGARLVGIAPASAVRTRQSPPFAGTAGQPLAVTWQAMEGVFVTFHASRQVDGAEPTFLALIVAMIHSFPLHVGAAVIRTARFVSA